METQKNPELNKKSEERLETENAIFFETTLKKTADALGNCLKKKLPHHERKVQIADALSLLRDKQAEIERGLLQGEYHVLFFLTKLAEYAQAGNVEEREAPSHEERQLKEFAKTHLLDFLDNERECLRSLVEKTCETNSGGELNNSDFEYDVYDLCRRYADLAFVGSGRSRNETMLSTLSFIHAVSPILETVGKVSANDESSYHLGRIRRMKHLASLAGEPNTIAGLVGEFLTTEKEHGVADSDFVSLNELFPGHTTWQHSYTNEEMARIAKRELYTLNYVKDGFTKEEIARAAEIFNESPGDRVAQKVLERYGLSRDKMIEVWKEADLTSTLQKNIVKIRELEKARPGATKEIVDGPGKIYCFERYDTDWLIEQLEPLKSGEEFGVMACAYEDPGGAFRNRQDLHRTIRDEASYVGIKTRLLEYHSEKMSLNELSDGLTNIAPPAPGETLPQATFVWLNQHGLSRKENEYMAQIEKEKWKKTFGIGSNRSSLVIRPGGAVACFMCYAGEEEGTMKQLADQYEITTTGPTRASDKVTYVRFSRGSNGDLMIEVDYNFDEDNPKSKGGKTATYKHTNKKTKGKKR